MKLSEFITGHSEAVLSEWQAFAATVEAGGEASVREQREHARPMLTAILADMGTPETERQRRRKSRGLLDAGDEEGPAAVHGGLRMLSGFTLPQVMAEFRAMRASVLRLWMRTAPVFTSEHLEEVARFNEAVDQALTRSVDAFHERHERSRDMFLAMLAHDLRSPLSTLRMTGELLTMSKDGEPAARARELGVRVKRGSVEMSKMVNDLLEYARAELGGAMPTSALRCDAVAICGAAVESARLAHPTFRFDLEGERPVMALLDAARLAQLLSNLLGNAAQYGEAGRPVEVSVRQEGGSAVIEVRNYGLAIPKEKFKSMFDPMVQLDEGRGARSSTSAGLGLFIAREIARAHGGTLMVESTAARGTAFTARFPMEMEGGPA